MLWLIGLSIMGKEFILSLVLFVMLFLIRVIFLYDNFVTSFFQSNDKWEFAFNTNIFISNFTFYYFFTESHFSLTRSYYMPFFTDSQDNLFSFIWIIDTLITSNYDE